METLTADTALVESYLWIPGALLYLPVGVLASVVVLELIDGVLGSRENDRAVLALLVFGIIAAVSAANLGIVMTFLLGDWGVFPFRNLLPGYVLGVTLLVTWAFKFFAHRSWRKAAALARKHRMTRQRTQGGRALTSAYRFFLVLSLLAVTWCISYKVDFGETPAYVTLGFPGEASAFPKPPAEKPPESIAVPARPPSAPPASTIAMADGATTDPAEEPPMEPEPEPEEPAEPQPQPMPKSAAVVAPVDAGLTVDFSSQVAPILEKSCYDCHGAGEDQAGLRLHTPSAIRKGSNDGPVIAAGKPGESSLYFLTILPPDDDDIMPSKGDPLTREESEILRVWIEEGAYLADGKAFADASAGGGEMEEGEDEQYPLSTAIVIPNDEYLELLRKDGIIVTEADEDLMLEIDFSKAKMGPGDLDLKVLYPLARNIVSLDLTRTKVTDDDLSPLREFANLAHLRLDRTNTGNMTLSYVSDLSKLETLTLFGTRISDSGVHYLDNLENLKLVNLMNTMVTPESAARLRKNLPDAEIQAVE